MQPQYRGKRAKKIVGSSLEASIKIEFNEKQYQIYKDIDFAELCITSKAEIVKQDQDNIKIETTKAEGIKCPVCWKISEKPCLRHG